MNQGIVEYYKTAYPTGTRVRLISMEDEPQMPEGLEGSVAGVDDAGQVHVEWSNGSTLAVIPNVDRFQKIEPVLEEPAPFEQTL